MTNAEFIAQFREEIEGLIKRYGSVKAKGVLQEGYKGGRLIGYEDALNAIKRIQDNLEKPTLESKKPMNLEGEINRYLREECSDDDEPGIHEIAEHFAQWGAEHLKK